MSVAVGAEYRAGETAPVSERYDFVRHAGPDSSCHTTAGERNIPLSRGETFPPCRSCRTGALWRLSVGTRGDLA
jgi:hypothetical protein